ncbi:hypothetical protein HGRIS_003880 [Hohenbuehelia grisea]|uniref:Uncharacterized protein n=1 Tax=Hohenbuehelia grisea TaxID=104357 RepID=A0ABR3JHT0_9AGAR
MTLVLTLAAVALRLCSVVALKAPTTSACRNPSLLQYTTITRETPCQTYERLRRICDPQYELRDEDPSAQLTDFCKDGIGSSTMLDAWLTADVINALPNLFSRPVLLPTNSIHTHSAM